jgi:hypothetical protein
LDVTVDKSLDTKKLISNISANFVQISGVTAETEKIPRDNENNNIIDLLNEEEEEEEEEEVQWIAGGYDNLAHKKRLEDDDEGREEEGDERICRGRGGRRRQGAESDEEAEHQFGWSMPADHNDLSAEALEAMPTHIRKSLIEEARRRERTRSRASYLPVAANPDLYSQTQLANFLNTR